MVAEQVVAQELCLMTQEVAQAVAVLQGIQDMVVMAVMLLKILLYIKALQVRVVAQLVVMT